MDASSEEKESLEKAKKARNFPSLDLSTTSTLIENTNQPILVIQSPKTPTLSRKLKAVSLDSEPIKKTGSTLDVSRDVFSMPNTPKRQLKQVYGGRFVDEKQPFQTTATLTSDFHLSSNLKNFPSNSSISSSQILKTLPEIMTLQDFSDSRPEPIRIKAKGLLERRGSNASLTIDLGNSLNVLEPKIASLRTFNNVKSISHVNLSTVGVDKCSCSLKTECEAQSSKKVGPSVGRLSGTLQKSQTQVEVSNRHVPDGKTAVCKNRCYTFHKKCNCLCNFKCRRKSLSNENLYIPPCSFCQSRTGPGRCGTVRHCKGCKRTVYPRQAGLCQSQVLSEDFKLHLQNVQYLQTAGSMLSITDLKAACEQGRVPKLHQEFWEVPLNLQEKCIVSGSQNKNRYKGVLPNEHSRVHLPGEQDYIHANYIKGPDYTESAYIATQGPMAHTCEDFWQMVWSNKCNSIVMLTGLIEKGHSKCELYFPLGRSSRKPGEKSFYYVTTTKVQDRFTFDFKNTKKYEEETVAFEELDEVTYGSYRIRHINRWDLGHYSVRLLELCKLDDPNKENLESRKIYHYWYPRWQDHKMASPEEVLELALDVLKRSKEIENDDDKEEIDHEDVLRDDHDAPLDNNSFNERQTTDSCTDNPKNDNANPIRSSNNNKQDVSVSESLQNDDISNGNAKFPGDPRKIVKTLRTSIWQKELSKLQDEIKQNLLKKSQSALDYFTSSKEPLNGDAINKKITNTFSFSLKTKSLTYGDSLGFEGSNSRSSSQSSSAESPKMDAYLKGDGEVLNGTSKLEPLSKTFGIKGALFQSKSKEATTSESKFCSRENVNLRFQSLAANGGIAKKSKFAKCDSCEAIGTTEDSPKTASLEGPVVEKISKIDVSAKASDRDSSSEADSLSLDFDLSSSLLPKKPSELSFPPIVVHCSAGIGRTGCFLAILNGIQQLRMNRNVDVLAILCSLRLNRGGMVQTAEQYELIHRVLKLYADSL